MPVLPFHRYIGPGNDINNGPCVDEDDCIAKQHDIKYENARTAEDVRQADVDAIREFRRNWMSGNWHSLIGDIGLSLKYCVETYTGVIYPKLADYQSCEILPLFNNLLRLHCVHKIRLYDRQEKLRFGRNVTAQLNEKNSNLPVENLIYVFILWYHFFAKYKPVFVNTSQPIRIYEKPLSAFKVIEPVSKSVAVVHNCHVIDRFDIFQLKTWIRFFTVVNVNQVEQNDGYNEDEFTNMFFQYD